MRTRKRPSTSGSLRSSPAIASSSPSGFPSTPSFPHAPARSGTLASHARSKRQPPRGRLSGGGRGANGQLGGDGNAARSTHNTSKKDGRRGRRASSDTREEKTAGEAGAAAVNAKDDATAVERIKEMKQVEEVTATPQSDQNRLGPKWKRGSERCSNGGHPQGARRSNNNNSNKANYSKSHHNNRKGRGGDGGESRSASNERNEHESSEDREGEEEEKEEGEEDLSGVTPAASAAADAVQPSAKHNAKARQQLETTTHNVTPRQNKKNKNNNIAGAVPTQKVKGNTGGAAPQATSTAAARNSRGATDVAPRPPGPATALQRGTAVKSKSNTTATAALSGAQTAAAAAAAVSHRRPSAPRTEGPPCVIAELPPDPCLVKVVCAAGVAVLPPSPSLNATATPEMQVDSASLPAAAAAASVMTTATLTMPSGGAGSDKGEEEKDLRRRGLRVDAAPWCPPPLFSLPVDLTGGPPPPPLPSLHDTAAAAAAAALHTGLSHAHTLGIFATPAPATHNGFGAAPAAGRPTLGSGGAALFAAPSVLVEAGHREAAPAVTITSTLSKVEGKNHSGAAAAETAAAAVTSLVGAAVAHSPSPTPPSLHPRRVGVAVLPITADAVATASTQANSAAGWQQREMAALAGGVPVCSPPSLSGSSPASSLSMAPSPSAIQPEWSPLYDRGRSSDHVTPTTTTTTTATALPPAGGDGENDSSSGATAAAAAALVHGAVATGPLNGSGVGVVPTHASVRPAAGHPIAVPATAAAAVMATVVGRWNTHSSPPSSVMREDDSDSGGVGTPLLMSPALEPHMRTATTAATESMTRAMVYGGGGSLSSVSGMVGGGAQSATVDRASSSGRGGISGSVSTTAEGGVEERPATAPAIRRPAMTVTNTATGARVSSSSLTTPAGSPLGPWATAAAAAHAGGGGGGAVDGSVRAAIANTHHYSSSGSGSVSATLTPALATAGGHAQYASLGSGGGGAGGVRSASSMERYSTREFPAVPFTTTTTTTAAAASSPYSRHSPPLQQQQPLVMSLSPHTQHSSPAGVMVVGVSSPSGQSSHSNSPQLSQHNSSSLPLGALQFPSMAAAGSGMVHTPSPSLSAQHHHQQHQQRSHTPLFSPSITGESDLDRVRHNRVAVSDMAAKNENTLVDTLFADADADVIEDDESELDLDDGSPNSGSAGGRGGGEWWPAYPMGTSPHSAVYSPDAYTRSYVTQQQQQQQQQQAYSYAYASSPTASGVYTSFGGGYWNQVGGTRHSGGGAGGAHAAGNTSGGGSSNNNNNAAAHHSRSHFSPSGIGGHRQLSTSCASVASSTLSLLDPRQPPPTDLGAAVYGLGEDEEEWEMNSSAYADSLDEAQIQWIEEQLKATENPVGYF